MGFGKGVIDFKIVEEAVNGLDPLAEMRQKHSVCLAKRFFLLASDGRYDLGLLGGVVTLVQANVSFVAENDGAV